MHTICILRLLTCCLDLKQNEKEKVSVAKSTTNAITTSITNTDMVIQTTSQSQSKPNAPIHSEAPEATLSDWHLYEQQQWMQPSKSFSPCVLSSKSISNFCLVCLYACTYLCVLVSRKGGFIMSWIVDRDYHS